MPKQACLYGSGAPRDSPLEGHSLWEFAVITLGRARNSVFYFLLFAVLDLDQVDQVVHGSSKLVSRKCWKASACGRSTLSMLWFLSLIGIRIMNMQLFWQPGQNKASRAPCNGTILQQAISSLLHACGRSQFGLHLTKHSKCFLDSLRFLPSRGKEEEVPAVDRMRMRSYLDETLPATLQIGGFYSGLALAEYQLSTPPYLLPFLLTVVAALLTAALPWLLEF